MRHEMNIQQIRRNVKMDIKDFKWTREPQKYTIADDKVEIVTQPGTDLWQRTYYHFRNDMVKNRMIYN